MSDVVLERVVYPQSSVAGALGTATIDGTTANFRLRWVFYDEQGEIALNCDVGEWRLAVIAPNTYLVDENGDRLRR